jgi:hypothetical protein
MAQRVTAYKKYLDSRRKNYRWVMQLPAGVEVTNEVHLISERPLIISELPITCDKESVKKIAELLKKRWFRKAVGGEIFEAIRRLVEGCGEKIEGAYSIWS